MTNYNDNTGSVRVDFFKPSGKWKYTEAIDMTGFWEEPLLEEAFRKALKMNLGNRMRGLVAVCLEPYHKNPYPQMYLIPSEE